MSPFIFNVGTFAVSNKTCMNFFKKQVIKHWDIVDHQSWSIFDDNGEEVDPQLILRDVIHDISVSETQYKELEQLQPQKKEAVLYLGLKGKFPDKLTEWKTALVKGIRFKQNQMKKNDSQGSDEEPNENEEEQFIDQEHKFLEYFPNMPYNYKFNHQLTFKNKYVKNFHISRGGWIPPTCCSLLINFIPWQLTFASIMGAKGQIQAFWLPELVRNDLTQHF